MMHEERDIGCKWFVEELYFGASQTFVKMSGWILILRKELGTLIFEIIMRSDVA